MCQTEFYDVVGKNKNLTSLAECKEFNPLCLQDVSDTIAIGGP